MGGLITLGRKWCFGQQVTRGEPRNSGRDKLAPVEGGLVVTGLLVKIHEDPLPFSLSNWRVCAVEGACAMLATRPRTASTLTIRDTSSRSETTGIPLF